MARWEDISMGVFVAASWYGLASGLSQGLPILQEQMEDTPMKSVSIDRKISKEAVGPMLRIVASAGMIGSTSVWICGYLSYVKNYRLFRGKNKDCQAGIISNTEISQNGPGDDIKTMNKVDDNIRLKDDIMEYKYNPWISAFYWTTLISVGGFGAACYVSDFVFWWNGSQSKNRNEVWKAYQPRLYAQWLMIISAPPGLALYGIARLFNLV